MIMAQDSRTIKQYVFYNKPDSLKKAILNGFDVNTPIDENGNTLLHLASNLPGKREIISCLLEHHASINQINKFGEFPLWCAARTSEDYVRLLLAHGADPNQRYTDGRTAFMKAAFSVMEGLLDISVLNYLLEYGAQPDVVDNSGMSTLMYAVKFNDLQLVKFLVKYGVDKDVLTPSGMTLQELAKTYNADSVAIFLSR